MKKAFKPIPGAKATGQLAKKPIKRQAIKEARIVATKTESKSIPVSDKMAGLTTIIYAIVRNVAKPAKISFLKDVLLSFNLNIDSIKSI